MQIANLPLNSLQANQQEKNVRFAKLASLFVMMVSFLVTIFFIVAALQSPEWQLILLASATAFTGFLSLIIFREIKENNFYTLVFLLLIITNFSLIIISATIRNAGIAAAMIILTISVAMSTLLLQRRSASGITIGIVSAALAGLVGFIEIVPQLIFPTFNVLLPIAFVFILMVFITLIQTGFMNTNLRIQLVLISLGITLIPLIMVSTIESSFVQNILGSLRNNSLNLAANQVSTQFDDFLIGNLNQLKREAELDIFQNYLIMPSENRVTSEANERLKETFNTFKLKEYNQFLNYGLLDIQGNNIYDTNLIRKNKSEANTDYFVQTMQTGLPYISEVRFDENEYPYIYFSTPILNDSDRIIGVLRMEYDALVLQYILEENLNLLGANSNAILVTDYHLRLADTISPNQTYNTIIPLEQSTKNSLNTYNWLPNSSMAKDSENLVDFAKAIEDFQVTPYFTANIRHDDSQILDYGVINKLSAKPWYLIYAQNENILFSIARNQADIFVLIAVIVSIVVGVLANIFSRTFSQPIVELSDSAYLITEGHLDTKVDIRSANELGRLGQAFNMMTEQLKNSIATLETRVAERTKALEEQNLSLEYRSSQLRTVAEVARNIVSSQELETLLDTTTHLISERFGYYHCGIFLLDEQREFAILRAANSTGGQAMLARNHQLRVGKVGIVGYATGMGEPRIATDVGQDATYFNNPDLPMTRSEMAIPLIANDEIIGALDIQSTESNAFTQEDIDLFRTLADQVAIAIYSNQLYNETRQALEETERVYRRYLKQEWENTAEVRKNQSIIYAQNNITYTDKVMSEEIQKVLETGQPIILEESEEELEMVIPISLRDQNIGFIKVKDQKGNKKTWSDEELVSVQSIANNVGLALENARLFEQTMRRANREQKVVEITSKIRETNDPQKMVQIAMQELKSALGTSKAQIIINNQLTQEAAPSNSVESGSNNGKHANNGTGSPIKD